MNSKAKAWVVAACCFVVVLLAVRAAQTERSNYRKLVSLANQRSGSLTACASELVSVGNRSKDEDLKFTAKYISTVFSTAADHGYKNIDEVRTSGNWGAFIQGGLNSILNPGGALSAIGKTFWLWTNDSAFKQAASRVEKRYGGVNLMPFLLGTISGVIGFSVISQNKRRSLV